MSSIIVKKFVGYWVDNNIIDEYDRDIYEYGFELLIFSLINVVAILATAFITNRIPESLALLAATIPIQSFGGGYHADTHLRCWLITLAVMAAGVMMAETLPFLWRTAAAVPAAAALFFLAPVEHENAPFSASFAGKMRRVVRILCIVYLAAAYLLRHFLPLLSACLSSGLILSALALCAARLRKRITVR